MENATEPTVTQTPPKPTKKNWSTRFVLFMLVLVLLVMTAGATYLWRDSKAKDAEKKQQATISALEQAKAVLETRLSNQKPTATDSNNVADETACTPVAPSASAIENIKASITSGNTAVLEGYMASSVNVVLAASEGQPAKTPTQAVLAVTDFISSDTASWDYNFALPASVLSGYSAGDYKDYFPSSAVVGKASNKKVISFSFDCDSKISTVFLVTSGDLL